MPAKTKIFKNLTEPECERLAHLLAPITRGGDIIALKGDLGAGKSLFARAFIRTAMGDENLDVPSPTYTLVQTYDPPGKRPPVWHVDLYRLENSEDLNELGLEDGFENDIVLIEWPEKMGKDLPEGAMEILFQPGDKPDLRTLFITPVKSWGDRLQKISMIRA